MSPGFLDEVDVARNPFARATMAPPAVSAQTVQGRETFTLKAVIHSVRKGVVLEDQAGQVYFLSENEQVRGTAVRSIGKDGVTIEQGGVQTILLLGGR